MKFDANLQTKKLELIQWLSLLEDSAIVDKIIELRKNESQDWWNSISSQEKEAIERGIKDADKGNLKKHTVAKKLYEKWL